MVGAIASCLVVVWQGLPASARVELPVTPRSAEVAAQQPLVIHSTGELDIAWEATTAGPGWVFRLYRRGGLEDFELLYELPAIPGNADYRVGHSASDGVQTYQLRVAARGSEVIVDREVVLGSFDVQVPRCQDTQSATSSQRSSPADLRRVPGLPEASLAASSASVPLIARLFEGAPPDPPPRLA